MRIYTSTGDDGTTGRLYGGRVAKTSEIVAAVGDVDEAISALGLARSLAQGLLAETLLQVQRELFVLGADISVNPERRQKLTAGVSRLSDDDVDSLERLIDSVVADHPLRPIFIVPGATELSAHLDHGRTVVRRAERSVLIAREADAPITDAVLRYLNRLSDLLFVLARQAAGEAEEPASHD